MYFEFFLFFRYYQFILLILTFVSKEKKSKAAFSLTSVFSSFGMAPKTNRQSGNRYGRYGILDEQSLSDPPDPSPSPPQKKIKTSSCVFSDSGFPSLPTKSIFKNPRFVHITAKDVSKPLSKVSIFILKKTIDSISTQYEKISQLKDGSILILAKDQTTADKFIQSKALDNICPVDIKLHANLNLSKGIVFAPCLVNVPETEIITELRSQNVTNVYKFTKLVQEKEKQIYIPSGLMIFTFDSFQIPETIEIGWYKTKVSEYVPNPMRCRQCQLLGHTIKWCKRAASCVTCNLPPHDDKNCIRTLCANCSGPHPASAKDCPKYVQSKEILEIKTKNKCTLAEARRTHKERNPISSTFSSNLYSDHLKHTTPETTTSITSTSTSSTEQNFINTEKAKKQNPFIHQTTLKPQNLNSQLTKKTDNFDANKITNNDKYKSTQSETPQKYSETNSDNEQIHTLNNYSRAQTKSNNGKTNFNENTQTTASSSSNSINQITSLTNFSPLSHTNFSLNIDDKNDTSQ